MYNEPKTINGITQFNHWVHYIISLWNPKASGFWEFKLSISLIGVQENEKSQETGQRRVNKSVFGHVGVRL